MRALADSRSTARSIAAARACATCLLTSCSQPQHWTEPREDLVAAGLAEADHPGVKLTADTVVSLDRTSSASSETEEQAIDLGS